MSFQLHVFEPVVESGVVKPPLKTIMFLKEVEGMSKLTLVRLGLVCISPAHPDEFDQGKTLDFFISSPKGMRPQVLHKISLLRMLLAQNTHSDMRGLLYNVHGQENHAFNAFRQAVPVVSTAVALAASPTNRHIVDANEHTSNSSNQGTKFC